MYGDSFMKMYRSVGEVNWTELSFMAFYSDALLVDLDRSQYESEGEKLLNQIKTCKQDNDVPRDTMPLDAIFAQLGDLPPKRLHALGQLARKLMNERRFSPSFGVMLAGNQESW